jgi:hypothetical protein
VNLRFWGSLTVPAGLRVVGGGALGLLKARRGGFYAVAGDKASYFGLTPLLFCAGLEKTPSVRAASRGIPKTTG